MQPHSEFRDEIPGEPSIGHNRPPTEREILEERLAAYEPEYDELERLSKREIPAEIKDEQEAGQITDYIGAVKKLIGTFSDIHKKEKQTFWECCTFADAWKRDITSRLEALIGKAEGPMKAFIAKKDEEERQRQLELAQKRDAEAASLATQAQAHHDAGIEDTAQELQAAAQQSQTAAVMIRSNAHTNIASKSRGSFASSTVKKTWTGEVESRAALDLEALRPYFKQDHLDNAVKAAVKDGVRDLRGARIFQAEKLSVR